MFEVGFTEIILILGIALVVLGPEKLPKVAADIGRWIGRARAMARQFKNQLDEEVVKADRDWTRPQPTARPKASPATRDTEVSPDPEPAPPQAPADASRATPEADTARSPGGAPPDSGTDSP